MIWLDHTKFATKIFCFCCFATEKVRPYTVRNFDWNSYLRRGAVASKESLLDLTFPAKAFKLDCGVKGPTRLSGCTLVLCQIRQQVKYRLSHRSVQPSKFRISRHLPPDHCWVALLSGRWTWRELNLKEVNLEGGELGGRWTWTWRTKVNLEKVELGGRMWTLEKSCSWQRWLLKLGNVQAETFSGPQFL